MSNQVEIPKVKYQSPFIVGSLLGLGFSFTAWMMAQDPVSAMPFGYIKLTLLFGLGFVAYDY